MTKQKIEFSVIGIEMPDDGGMQIAVHTKVGGDDIIFIYEQLEFAEEGEIGYEVSVGIQSGGKVRWLENADETYLKVADDLIAQVADEALRAVMENESLQAEALKGLHDADKELG